MITIKHITALAIKFISSLVLLYIILGMIFNMSFANVFLISLVLGVVAYLVGDLFILPRTTNMMATLADFGLALIIIWVMSAALTNGGSPFTMSLIAAIGVAVFEYFFHKYVSKNVLNDQSAQRPQGRLQYQTEMSEELSPVRPDVRSSSEDENK